MADNTTGMHVKSLASETVRSKLVDTGGTNEAAISAGGRLSVDGSGVTQPVSGTVAVSSITTSITPGTAAANLGKAVDSAAGGTDTGVAVLAVRDDALSTLTPADGDYVPLRVNDQGALHIVSTGGPSGTEYTEGATDATITGTAIMWEDTSDTLRPVSAASPLPMVQIGATPAGTNNIGDVDVLTVPAPLSTSGNGTAASALRVTLASDSTGVVTLTGSLPAGTNNIGDVDVLTLPNVTLNASTNTIEVVGDAAHDAVLAGNPVLIGMAASAAAPADVSADGDVVRPWSLRNGSQVVNIAAGGTLWTNMGQAAASGQFVRLTDGTLTASVRDTGTSDSLNVAIVDAAGNQITSFGGGTQYAGDAAATATPTGTMAMGLANAAAPTNVSANADAVPFWALLNGSQVVNLASGGTLITIGQKAMASSIPVVISSDQSAIAVTPAANSSVNLSQVGGNSVVTGGVNGSQGVGGLAASDAAVAGNPIYYGGRASAAAPTDVSADGDVVPAWHLRNGAQATVITAAGALVGGDATNGLDVDVTRVQGTVASNITQAGGATLSATAFLPARLTDGTAYYTNTGQTAGTAPFTRITDATNTAAVIATINSLKTDLSSVAGAVPSATNPVPVRLTDGSAFYASASGAPSSPQSSTVTSSALGAGSSVDLDFTAITGGTTGQLTGVDVSSAVPLKIEIKTVNAGTPTTRIVLFTQNGDNLVWRAPFKTYITQAGGATSRFRVTVTNRDNAQASDVYATGFWDQI